MPSALAVSAESIEPPASWLWVRRHWRSNGTPQGWPCSPWSCRWAHRRGDGGATRVVTVPIDLAGTVVIVAAAHASLPGFTLDWSAGCSSSAGRPCAMCSAWNSASSMSRRRWTFSARSEDPIAFTASAHQAPESRLARCWETAAGRAPTWSASSFTQRSPWRRDRAGARATVAT